MHNGHSSLAAICSFIIIGFFSTRVTAIRSIAESPECAKRCNAKPAPHEIPLCAVNPVPEGHRASEGDLKNTFSCWCTDKLLIQRSLPCILRECASNSTAIEVWFTQTYDECNKLGGVQYPSPPDFLKALNIRVPANVTIPRTIIGVPQATTFPSSTATTLPLHAIPTQYLVGRPASDEALADATTRSAVAIGKFAISGEGGPGRYGPFGDTAAYVVPAVVLTVVSLTVFL